jgi:hypothetical protein
LERPKAAIGVAHPINGLCHTPDYSGTVLLPLKQRDLLNAVPSALVPVVVTAIVFPSVALNNASSQRPPHRVQLTDRSEVGESIGNKGRGANVARFCFEQFLLVETHTLFTALSYVPPKILL